VRIEKQDEGRRVAVAEFVEALVRLVEVFSPPPVPSLPQITLPNVPNSKENEPLKVWPYMDTKTLAELLGLAVQTLRIWRVSGGGPPYIRVGGSRAGRVLYKREDVEAWLLERRFPHTAAETVHRDTLARESTGKKRR
jgi:hypothetical protein